jgi:hypothetical protein
MDFSALWILGKPARPSLRATRVENAYTCDCEDCEMKTYQERCEQARHTTAGDNWRHIKTGKTVIVMGRIGAYGIILLHQSGKRTTKRDHYLASDYELLNANKY